MKINVYAELVEAKENDPIHGYTMEVDAFGFDAAIRSMTTTTATNGCTMAAPSIRSIQMP
jgi:hypothetical protein